MNLFTKLTTIFSCVIFFTALSSKDYKTNLQIKNPQGKKVNNFLVSIAKDDEQLMKGLMFVTYLPQNYGMIFEFKNEHMVYMWMKNTKIPLDMLFIDKTKTIVSIKNKAEVESLDSISSIKPVTKVLEINGGLAKKLGIAVGDKVEY